MGKNANDIDNSFHSVCLFVCPIWNLNTFNITLIVNIYMDFWIYTYRISISSRNINRRNRDGAESEGRGNRENFYFFFNIIWMCILVSFHSAWRWAEHTHSNSMLDCVKRESERNLFVPTNIHISNTVLISGMWNICLLHTYRIHSR